MVRPKIASVVVLFLALLGLCPFGAAADDADRPADLQPALSVSQHRVANFQNYGYNGMSTALSADGNSAVLSSGNNLVFHDLTRGSQATQPRQVPLDNTMNLYNASFAFAPDGKTVAGLCANGYPQDPCIHFWDSRTGKEIRQIDNDEQFHAVALSPDGKLLALAGYQNVQVWDAETGDTVRTIAVPANQQSHALAFSADGKMLATLDMQFSIHVWEVATGGQRAVFHPGSAPPQANLRGPGMPGMMVFPQPAFYQPGMQTMIYAVAFSSDGNILAAGGSDNAVRLWDLATGRELPPLAGHTTAVTGLTFTPDGKHLVSFDQSGLKLVWDARRLGRQRSGRLPVLTDAEFEELWNDLTESDSFRSYRAVRHLAADPARALALLRRHLQPVPPGDSRRIGELINDLQNMGDGSKRRRAMAELRKHGEAALGALSQLPDMQKQQSQAVQIMLRRLETLTFSPERLAAVKAVPVLEQIGNDEAKGLLEKLAKGAAGARLTVTAKAALDQLAARKVAGPDQAEAALKKLAARLDEAKGEPAAEDLQDLVPLWNDLGGAEPARAFHVLQLLKAHPKCAVLLLKQRLEAVAPVDAKRVEQLISDLDSETFEIREKASRELEALGRRAGPALQKRLPDLSLEAKRRAEALLQKIEHHGMSKDELRAVRSVEVLEGVGGADGRQVLQKLAGGAPGVRITDDAKQALARLGKRPTATP